MATTEPTGPSEADVKEALRRLKAEMETPAFAAAVAASDELIALDGMTVRQIAEAYGPRIYAGNRSRESAVRYALGRPKADLVRAARLVIARSQ